MILLFLCLLIHPGSALAVNPFALGKVNYFTDEKATLNHERQVFDWRETVIGPQGQLTYYVPPEPVIHFLDDPTPENAQLYLQWQNQRLDRIRRAGKVLENLRIKSAY